MPEVPAHYHIIFFDAWNGATPSLGRDDSLLPRCDDNDMMETSNIK